MKKVINFEDPELLKHFEYRGHQNWIKVATAFQDFIWENLDQQFLESPEKTWDAFIQYVRAGPEWVPSMTP